MDASTVMEQERQVLSTVRGGLGIVTLNRPAALNALTLTMVRELEQILGRWAHDDSVKAVLLRGAGEKAFCAGGDIRAIYDSFKAGNSEYLTFFGEEYALDRMVHRYEKPTIALMGGFVMGGGMGLAQGCKFRVVTDTARLAMPEVGIGYFPDVGGSYFLSRLPGALGPYLGLTGVQLKAPDALCSGLADLYVPSVHVDDLVTALGTGPWSAQPLEDVQAVVSGFAVQPPVVPLEALRPAIDLHFSQASIAAIVASLRTERRPDYAQWAEQTLAIMADRSPIAMSVTLEQLHRGAHLSLEECLEMEFHMDQEWLPRGDMVEGVRALIVDKDMRPRWSPASLDAVTQDLVQSFFERKPTHRPLRLT